MTAASKASGLFQGFFFSPLVRRVLDAGAPVFLLVFAFCAVLVPGAWRIGGFCFLLQINCCKDSFLFTVDVWLLE